MRTDLAELARARYDLVVVGGGIHGLFAAYDAAGRGLSVALVERGDFGGGLSFNHQRTIHGGLRDVGSGRFGKARAQVTERRVWAHIAPHLIRPLPFLIGTYRLTKRSRSMMRAGLGIYDFVGRARNAGVPPELHLPKGRLESVATTRRLFPGVSETGLTGGAVWYDYQTTHPDRLTWVVALAAKRAGARLVNYVEAVAPLCAGGRVIGVRVRDVVTGREQEIQATATLLAAGTGLRHLARAFGVQGAPPLVRTMNLLLDRPARDIATAAPGPSGRMLTVVPWRGHALVGTYQSPGVVDAALTVPGVEVVDEMLVDVNATFPALRVSRADIRLVHHGLVPAVAGPGGADLLPTPSVLGSASGDAPGVRALVGVKFTTARQAAAAAINAVCHDLGKTGTCRTAEAALPHAGISDVEGRLVETLRSAGLSLDREVLDHLTGWYASEAPAVVAFSASRHLVDRLSPDSTVLAGEIAYAAEQADAVHLSDAVLRRTPLGSVGHPGRLALDRAAEVMGSVTGWTATERDHEIRLVEERFYVPGKGQ